MSTRALSSRYAAYYGAVFLTLGVYLPFWPLWLAHRGLGAGEIGLLLALASWIKVLSNPAIAQVADRSGRAKAVLVAAAALTLVAFAGFFAARGFWPILGVTLLAAAFFQALIPLAESQTMAAVARERLDYGRIRLWGSLTFILGTAGAGRLLTGRDPDLVLVLILAALGLTVAAALALPGRRPQTAPAGRRALTALLRERRFLLFLGAASLLQASHAVYYGFSALHWRAAGLSEAAVGWLWAEGVIAEVVLFAASGPVVARAGPVGLLLAAGAAGVIRWAVLGATTALPALLAVQVLHAATFGAAHLGAMHFIARAAPPGLSATAQALYSAVSGGLAMGLAMLIAGRLYADLGGGAFTAMAALSAAGGLLALVLARRERRAALRLEN
ncbi:MAG: 3-phenylpropionate MFS transporter [Kiloniellaceae bacterium]